MSLTVQQRYCARTLILAHPCLNLSYVRDLVRRSKDGVGLDKGWLLLEQISILICEWAPGARAQVSVSVNWGWCQFWVVVVFGREEWTWKVLWSRLQIPTFGLWGWASFQQFSVHRTGAKFSYLTSGLSLWCKAGIIVRFRSDTSCGEPFILSSNRPS